MRVTILDLQWTQIETMVVNAKSEKERILANIDQDTIFLHSRLGQ